MTYVARRLPTLAVVGESHADPFMGSYLADAQGTPLAAVAYAHVPALRAEYFLDRQGRVSARIVAALCALRLLLYCEANHPKVISPAIMEQNLYNPEGGYGWRINPALADTPLLFVCGEVDVRAVLRAIPPHADVPVPFAADALARIPTFPATAAIAPDSVSATIGGVLAPLFAALALLRGAGFTAIALHSVSPPTADDAQYLREIHHDTRALTRYKVTMLFNAAMRDHCAANGLHFVDRWNDFTSGGLIREGYGADAVHVSDAVMRESLTVLYALTLGRRLAA